jgi:hypothetical protein
MPLKSAFAEQQFALPLANKKTLSEMGDVRIYLHAGSTPLCKAQLPLWRIAQLQEDAARAADSSVTLAAAAATPDGLLSKASSGTSNENGTTANGHSATANDQGDAAPEPQPSQVCGRAPLQASRDREIMFVGRAR